MKLLDWILSFFKKKDEVKYLNEGKKDNDFDTNSKMKFLQSIKFYPKNKKRNVKVIPNCVGDGLGIDTKLDY